jgi:ABC-type microcin C transport system permease subunit YejE
MVLASFMLKQRTTDIPKRCFFLFKLLERAPVLYRKLVTGLLLLLLYSIARMFFIVKTETIRISHNDH